MSGVNVNELVGKYVAANISLQNAKYILAFILGGSGASKFFVQKQMNKDWPTLPMWFWPICGLWELASLGLLFNNQEKIALPLLYVFMGGVYCSVTVLDLKKIPMIVVPTFTTAVIATVGYHQKHSEEHLIPCLAAGFLIGIVLSFLGGSKKKTK